MVEVFKTNVPHKSKSRELLCVLGEHFPGHKINFDLADCDKILRVEGNPVQPRQIIELVTSNGYTCEVLQ
jgi:hypothetical protein